MGQPVPFVSHSFREVTWLGPSKIKIHEIRQMYEIHMPEYWHL